MKINNKTRAQSCKTPTVECVETATLHNYSVSFTL
jgi:hypothetical protein